MNSSQTQLLQTSSIILQVFWMSNDSQRQPIFMKFSNFWLYGGLSLQNQALKKDCWKFSCSNYQLRIMKYMIDQWYVILQKKVWRVSFFRFAGIFEVPTFKVISFTMFAETSFFSAFLYSAQDLSQKIRKSWTLLIRVSISLIAKVHDVNGVGGGGGGGGGGGLLFGWSQFCSSQSLIHFYLSKY